MLRTLQAAIWRWTKEKSNRGYLWPCGSCQLSWLSKLYRLHHRLGHSHGPATLLIVVDKMLFFVTWNIKYDRCNFVSADVMPWKVGPKIHIFRFNQRQTLFSYWQHSFSGLQIWGQTPDLSAASYQEWMDVQHRHSWLVLRGRQNLFARR